MVTYVQHRIAAQRQAAAGRGGGRAHQNVAALRANGMKSLPHYFRRGQLRALLFLFPDPHFKAANHRRVVAQVPSKSK